MVLLNVLVIVITTFMIAIFAAQNPTAVTVQFVALQSVELPLGLIMTLAGCLGALTVVVAYLLWPHRQRSLSQAARQLQERVDRLQHQDPDPSPSQASIPSE